MQTTLIYIYSKCSTCQKALRFLERTRVRFLIKEIVLTPPSIEELERMLIYQEGNIKKLFNTTGLLYREMRLSEKLQQMTKEQSLTLLNQHGMLVKRPFVLGYNFGLLGFIETQWSRWFTQS